MDVVFKIALSKSSLRLIPKEERALLFFASSSINQINVFQKLTIFASNYQPKDDWEAELSAGQTQVVLRMWMGILGEIWIATSKPIYQRLIGQDYLPRMRPEGQQAYTELKKHFGSSNLLARIRNTIAFHHPTPTEWDEAFEALDENVSGDWFWYPAASNANSFYLLSDVVISSAIRRATGEADTAKAFKIVLEEMRHASLNLGDFFADLTGAIVSRRLGQDALKPIERHKIRKAPDLHKFGIPFFVETDIDPDEI